MREVERVYLPENVFEDVMRLVVVRGDLFCCCGEEGEEKEEKELYV